MMQYSLISLVAPTPRKGWREGGEGGEG